MYHNTWMKQHDSQTCNTVLNAYDINEESVPGFGTYGNYSAMQARGSFKSSAQTFRQVFLMPANNHSNLQYFPSLFAG